MLRPMVRASRKVEDAAQKGAKESHILVASLKITVRFWRTVLRCQIFEMHKPKYASDAGWGEGLRDLPPLATSTRGLGGGCNRG